MGRGLRKGSTGQGELWWRSGSEAVETAHHPQPLDDLLLVLGEVGLLGRLPNLEVNSKQGWSHRPKALRRVSFSNNIGFCT